MRYATYGAALLLLTAAIAAVLTVRPPASSAGSGSVEERETEIAEVRPYSNAPTEQTEVSPASVHGARHEPVPQASRVDRDTSRKLTREIATKETLRYYSRLLEHLGLNRAEREALMVVLIDDQLSRTTTPYMRGAPTDSRVRSERIASVIGEAKLGQFLSLERDVAAYGEVHSIESMLEQQGAPMSEQQQDKLLRLMIAARDELETKRLAALELTSIEHLEQAMAARNEYERHVLELSASALSGKQVQHLFDYFQIRSQERARAVELNIKLRADNPSAANFVITPQ